MIDEIISHYRIIARLGEGGMGVVYKAEDTRLGRYVALKFLSHPELDSGEIKERFLREAQAVAALNHPGICTIYAIEEHQGQPFIAMELVEGGTLDNRLTAGVLPAAEAIDIVTQIASGMQEAHARGIIHRDIKPGNILITDQGRIKITDFGLARLLQDTRLTRTGTTMGTLAYISPEQVLGGEVDQRCDVWSLGVMFHQLLTGQLPLQADSEASLLYLIAHGDPLSGEDLLPDHPRDLQQVISGMLARDPVERISDMETLLGILRSLTEQETRPLAQQTVAPKRPARSYRSGRAALVAVTLLAIIIVVWQIFFTPQNALSFAERDWILLSDVDNRTDDQAFDLALKAALETDLQQSRYVNVYDRNQVNRTLNFMRCSPDTFISEAVGRDICRYAGIKALLLPRILKIDDVYELYATLIDPVSGRHVDRIRVTVKGRENVLLQAIDQLCAELRSRLGESLAGIEMNDVRVVETTTSSWEALRLFALAYEKWGERQLGESARLFQMAIDEDPDYVLAKGALGLLRIQFLGEPESGKALLDEAYENSAAVSERERIMIRAIHREYVLGDAEGAYGDYGVISDLYPDMAEPYNNRGMYLQSQGRYQEAVVQFEKAAQLDRFFTIPLSNLYWTYLNYLSNPVEAEMAARRLLNLDPTVPNYIAIHGWTLVALGRFQEAETAMRRVVGLVPDHRYACPNLAHLLLRRGEATEALPIYRTIYRSAVDEGDTVMIVTTGQHYAMAMAMSGDTAGAERELIDIENRYLAPHPDLDSIPNYSLIQLAQVKALRGLESEARDLLERALERNITVPVELFAISTVFAILNSHEEAISHLEVALDKGYSGRYYCLIYPCFLDLQTDSNFQALIYGSGTLP
jgi:eukaryotic-like serine/threonine-protein kinase